MNSETNISKKVVVLGGGISGLGAAVLAASRGYDVFLSDRAVVNDAFAKALNEHGISYESGAHTLEKLIEADVIIKSPGIPDHIDLIKQLKQAGIEIISEIEFAFREEREVPVIAITGSNGKTTTTSLMSYLLETAQVNATTGGNIGESYALQVAQKPANHRLLEVSSFQLDGCYEFAPHIAILLNITPDHLDRYDYQFENYIDSKMRIAQSQKASDYFIYNADDQAITEALKNKDIKAQLVPFSMTQELKHGAFIKDNQIIITLNNTLFTMPIQELALKGKHNTANTMAAATAATLLKIRKETIRQSLQSFKGVEHRLENVLKINKVQYINDSKATNVNATYFALDSMEHPTVWIVGGVDKGNNYSDLYELVNRKVKAIVCLGIDNGKIIENFAKCVDTVVETSSMEDAVRVAYRLAKAGDNVLLSPACASFDLFENYEDRGRQFKAAVRNL